MARALSDYARLLLRDPSYLRNVGVPLLLWQCPPEAPAEELLLHTGTTSALARPTAQEPLVFEVRKSEKASNAFSMGITVGRTDNNDLVIEDHSVSRFHAYFQQDRKTGAWTVVDAESKNGTRVNGVPLEQNRATPIVDRMHVRFGEVDSIFFEGGSLEDHLQSIVRGDARF